MGIFQSNAGGAWDNAKKSFEKGVMINGEMFYKKSEPHKASVTGDTVGDPFKDTSGPSMNILIKLMSIVSLVIAPYIAVQGGLKADKLALMNGEKMECCAMDSMDMDHCGMMGNCDMSKCMNMTKEECAAYCDSMKCTPEQKAMCQSMYGTDGKFDMAKCKAMCEKESACMEGCDKGCKTEEECMKSCDKACVAAHKEGKSCCDDDKEHGHDKK
jgi:K(+)-stimulated pyrophosphate-energized sodium pump